MPKKHNKNSRVAASVSELLERLSTEYGAFVWEPRYSPAEELVFTILSQHTSDINSERAFKNLMSTFGSIEAIAAADVTKIEDAIRSAGLFRTKAPRIKKVLNDIYGELGSFDLSFLVEMPLADAKTWLKRWDGIGPKTAAIILCFSLGLPAMPVDTHIHRVSKRLGLISPTTSADQAHDILESMVPAENVFEFHLFLITHGRQICKALRPKCDDCLFENTCPSRNQFERSRH